MEQIIVEHRHDQWTAWYADHPQVVFDGQTPTEAVYRLTGPDKKPETWRDKPGML